jgi:hypothetical protein
MRLSDPASERVVPQGDCVVVQDCPNCGLINPQDAQRCDCGYDFASRSMRESYLKPQELAAIHSPTAVEIAVCVLLPVIGIILGLRARSRGRRPAGRMMLLISGAMLVVGLAVRLVLELVK